MFVPLSLAGVLLAPSTQANPYLATPALSVRQADPFFWELEAPVLAAGDDGVIVVRLVVPRGHVVYRDQLQAQVLGGGDAKIGPADFPPALVGQDPVDGMERELYDMDVVMEFPVQMPKVVQGDSIPVALRLRFQGCYGGLCYPPRTERRILHVPIARPDDGGGGSGREMVRPVGPDHRQD